MDSIKLSGKKKMRNSLFIVFTIFILLVIRIGFIQLIEGKELKKLAYEQQTLDRVISPKRGNIFDTTGKISWL